MTIDSGQYERVVHLTKSVIQANVNV